MKRIVTLALIALLGTNFYGFSKDHAFFTTQAGRTLMVEIYPDVTFEEVERQVANELGSENFKIVNHNSGKDKFAGVLGEDNFDAWRLKFQKAWRSFQKKHMAGVIIVTPPVEEEQLGVEAAAAA